MKKHKLNPKRVDDKEERVYIEQYSDSTLEYIRMLDREAVVQTNPPASISEVVDDKVAREYIEQDRNSTLEYIRMLDREAVVFEEKKRRERLQKVIDTLIDAGKWGIFVGLPAVFVVALAVMLPIEEFLIAGGLILLIIGLTIAKD